MTERERRRHELLQRLGEVLGPEHAATIMGHLPPDRWDELATKRDLERFATRQDLERFATRRDLERFATREDLRREVAHLGDVLAERIEGQGFRLEALLRERVDAQTKMLVFSIVGAVLTAASIGVGSAAI